MPDDTDDLLRRLGEALEAVRAAQPDIPGIFFDISSLVPKGSVACVRFQIRKIPICRVHPEVAALTDEALRALVAHEAAHVAVAWSGGQISDEPAAVAKSAEWGFPDGKLHAEVEAIKKGLAA